MGWMMGVESAPGDSERRQTAQNDSDGGAEITVDLRARVSESLREIYRALTVGDSNAALAALASAFLLLEEPEQDAAARLARVR